VKVLSRYLNPADELPALRETLTRRREGIREYDWTYAQRYN
jgi:hypothetical protein